MKKIIILASLLLITASAVFAQSLANNEFYKKSVEFTKLSEKALADGEYDMSADYAIKAQENAALSKKYIAEMVAAYRARTALTAAKERFELAGRYNYQKRDTALYESASALFKSANTKFNGKNYTESTADSVKLIELLKEITPLPKKPEFYIVQLNKEKRDCLWRIAGFDFVYGNPWKWKLLYEANKDTMPEKGNPSLIEPGQVIKIPSLEGEERSGTYAK